MPSQSINSDELPLKPVSGPDPQSDLEQSGRQAASFKLTEEGRDYLRSGRLDEARSKFEKAISLSSSNPYAYFYLGEVRYLKQEYKKSLPLLERAELFLLRDTVWLSRVHVLRGKNYEGLSLFDEARDQYQQALAEDPNNPEAQEGIQRLQNSGGLR
ncbi:MAG: tetratricopeptide repeat protein [Nitrospira sp.]|nr:tetratricopeptide repeat protein [Nitrospira sp.]